MSRLILIIVILSLFLAFIVLNMDNNCDISFGVKKFSDIPVFVLALSSFVLGMVFALPFGLSLFRRLKKDAKTEPHTAKEPKAGKKKLWGKNKNKDKDSSDAALVEEIKKDSSPYGID